jgi:hypothetical protein
MPNESKQPPLDVQNVATSSAGGDGGVQSGSCTKKFSSLKLVAEGLAMTLRGEGGEWQIKAVKLHPGDG